MTTSGTWLQTGSFSFETKIRRNIHSLENIKSDPLIFISTIKADFLYSMHVFLLRSYVNVYLVVETLIVNRNWIVWPYYLIPYLFDVNNDVIVYWKHDDTTKIELCEYIIRVHGIVRNRSTRTQAAADTSEGRRKRMESRRGMKVERQWEIRLFQNQTTDYLKDFPTKWNPPCIPFYKFPIFC